MLSKRRGRIECKKKDAFNEQELVVSETTIEERLIKLEKLVDQLMHRSPSSKDWRQSIGMFDGDPIMKEVIDEGRRVRDEDRSVSNS